MSTCIHVMSITKTKEISNIQMNSQVNFCVMKNSRDFSKSNYLGQVKLVDISLHAPSRHSSLINSLNSNLSVELHVTPSSGHLFRKTNSKRTPIGEGTKIKFKSILSCQFELSHQIHNGKSSGSIISRRG